MFCLTLYVSYTVVRVTPKRRKKKVLMALRFQPEFADFIRKAGKRPGMTQARVVEIALTLHGKEVRFNFGSKA